MRRFVRESELTKYLSCSRQTARRIAEQANARRKVEGILFYDVSKIDEFISSAQSE